MKDKTVAKTNALRILDAMKISYLVHEYDEEVTDGESVAALLGQDPDSVFKTLVTVGNDLEHYVFVVPVSCTLDLKKAAASVGVKRVEMIKQKELFPLTGYVHGGCSPVGMKKKFTTVISDVAPLFPTICVSGGRRGLQIELSPALLQSATDALFGDII